MPAAYEKMRDAFKSEGMSDQAAKGKAAAIFNANAKPGQPIVTSAGEGYTKKRKPKAEHYARALR